MNKSHILAHKNYKLDQLILIKNRSQFIKETTFSHPIQVALHGLLWSPGTRRKHLPLMRVSFEKLIDDGPRTQRPLQVKCGCVVHKKIWFLTPIRRRKWIYNSNTKFITDAIKYMLSLSHKSQCNKWQITPWNQKTLSN